MGAVCVNEEGTRDEPIRSGLTDAMRHAAQTNASRQRIVRE